MIRKRSGQSQTTNYSREFEAIAKFSGRDASRRGIVTSLESFTNL